MESESKVSNDLARAISLVVSRAPGMDPDAIVAALNQIEAEFLRQVSSSDRLKLETKRRVAEWKFKVLSEHGLPFSEVERLYAEVRDLGFTDLETEGTLAIYFAQHCVAQSRVQDARQALQTFCAKLDDALTGYQRLKQDVQDFLSSI